MPLKVLCPHCNKELTAPDELAGQYVACPRCQQKFAINENDDHTRKTVSAANPSDWMLPPARNDAAKPDRQAGPPVSGPPQPAAFLPPTGPPAPPAGPPMPSPPTPQPGEPLSRSMPPTPNADAGLPPTTMPPQPGSTVPPQHPQGGPPTAVPAGRPLDTNGPASAVAGKPRFLGPPPAAPGGDEAQTKPLQEVASAVADAKPIAGPSHPSPQPAFRGGPQTRKVVQRPKVIINDAAATKVALGADGKLPELKLEKVADEDEAPLETASKSPLLVIGALVVSFAASIGMLFLPENMQTAEPSGKQKALESIRKNYIQPPPGGVVAPHQKLLRSAIQAHELGRSAEERQYYRQVLDMLRSENQSSTRGLTGRKTDKIPPNDEDLERLLSALLSRG